MATLLYISLINLPIFHVDPYVAHSPENYVEEEIVRSGEMAPELMVSNQGGVWTPYCG